MGSNTWIYFGAPGDEHYKPPLHISMERWPCRASQPHGTLKSSSSSSCSKGRRLRRKVGREKKPLSRMQRGRAALAGSREAARGKHRQPRAAPRAEQLLAAHTAIRLFPASRLLPGLSRAAPNNRRQIITAIYYVQIKKNQKNKKRQVPQLSMLAPFT